MKSGDLVVVNASSCFGVAIGLVQGGNVGCIYCLLQHEFNIKFCMFATGLCIKNFAHIYAYIIAITIHDKDRNKTSFTDSMISLCHIAQNQ